MKMCDRSQKENRGVSYLLSLFRHIKCSIHMDFEQLCCIMLIKVHVCVKIAIPSNDDRTKVHKNQTFTTCFIILASSFKQIVL